MRFAFGGIHIECSTYSHILTRIEDFKVLTGDSLAAAPDFAHLRVYPHQFHPTLYARAIPGGPVDRDAYETLKNGFLRSLKELLPLHGLYLPMHGALFVDGMQDAEGDWIASAREIVGPECLISASYDLHGNISRRVVDNIDMLSAYRTAPHIDVVETQQRACDMLVRCATEQLRPCLVWVPIPLLLPGERTSTEDEPAKGLYAQLPTIDEKDGVMDASLLVGYVWADEPRATASAVLTGTNPDVLKHEASMLAQQYWDARDAFQFGVPVGTISEMLDRAAACATKPVILADSGDNPTGGGVGDRAEMLEVLLQRGFQNALVAGIADPPATDICYQHVQGDTLQLTIGAALDPEGSRPIKVTAQLLLLLPTDNLRDRIAVVRVDGVTVVLTASRRPFHNISDFTKLGLNIPDFKLLVVKSGYLSPELAPIANPNLMALSDGSILQDLDKLPKKKFRPPTYPFEPTLAWQPSPILSKRSYREME
ncbi:MAG: M81 family metallopeptidase [Acidobacteria bacterium]|nr:M81 family metallopeptidase [Acidobacteriota bacterium]